MIKKTLSFLHFFILSLCLSAQTISITTDHTQLVLKVSAQKRLYQAYLGQRLTDRTDLSLLSMPQAGMGSSMARGLEAYPVMGTEDYYEPAFEIRHADGNPTSFLKYQQHTTETLPPSACTTRSIPSKSHYIIRYTQARTSYNSGRRYVTTRRVRSG